MSATLTGLGCLAAARAALRLLKAPHSALDELPPRRRAEALDALAQVTFHLARIAHALDPSACPAPSAPAVVPLHANNIGRESPAGQSP